MLMISLRSVKKLSSAPMCQNDFISGSTSSSAINKLERRQRKQKTVIFPHHHLIFQPYHHFLYYCTNCVSCSIPFPHIRNQHHLYPVSSTCLFLSCCLDYFSLVCQSSWPSHAGCYWTTDQGVWSDTSSVVQVPSSQEGSRETSTAGECTVLYQLETKEARTTHTELPILNHPHLLQICVNFFSNHRKSILCFVPSYQLKECHHLKMLPLTHSLTQ